MPVSGSHFHHFTIAPRATAETLKALTGYMRRFQDALPACPGIWFQFERLPNMSFDLTGCRSCDVLATMILGTDWF